MPRSLYAYCPNPGCAYLQSPEAQALYAADVGAAGTPSGACPHCRAELRTTCPACGQSLHDRPQRYCPACGASLFPRPAGAPCRICGRPVAGHAAGGAETLICSERCLRIFIQRHVRVCDQCGRRFTIQAETRGELAGLKFPGQEGPPRDFCSRDCCMEYVAAGKRNT